MAATRPRHVRCGGDANAARRAPGSRDGSPGALALLLGLAGGGVVARRDPRSACPPAAQVARRAWPRPPRWPRSPGRARGSARRSASSRCCCSIAAGIPLPGLGALTGRPLLALALAVAVVALAAARAALGAARLHSRAARRSIYAGRGARAGAGRPGGRRAALPDGRGQPAAATATSRSSEDYAEGRYAPSIPRTSAPHYRVRGRGRGDLFAARRRPLAPDPARVRRSAATRRSSFFMALLGGGHRVAGARAACARRSATTGWPTASAGSSALSPPLAALRGARLHRGPGRAGRGPRACGTAAAAASARARAGAPGLPLASCLAERALRDPGRHPPRVRAGAPAGAARGRGLAGSRSRPPRPALAAVPPGPLRLLRSAPRLRPPARVRRCGDASRPGCPGCCFDQEFGLLVYAPVFALAVPGLVRAGAARGGSRRPPRPRSSSPCSRWRRRGRCGAAASTRPRASSCPSCPRWPWRWRAG